MLRLLLVYAHLLSTVFLVGFALFGLILSLGGTDLELRRRVLRSSWPPPGLPAPVRFSVYGLGWLGFGACTVTGALLLATRPGAPPMGYVLKILVIAVASAVQFVATLAPRPTALRLYFLLLLAVVWISATLAR